MNNLLRGNFIGPWMQNTIRRLSGMLPQMATAQDGGLPVAGLLAQVDKNVQTSIIKEFFLS
jgi:hypothetical protein